MRTTDSTRSTSYLAQSLAACLETFNRFLGTPSCAALLAPPQDGGSLRLTIRRSNSDLLLGLQMSAGYFASSPWGRTHISTQPLPSSVNVPKTLLLRSGNTVSPLT